jgi:hypothetical protein
MPGRRPAWRPLADGRAVLADVAEELAVSRRVGAVHAAGEDSDRCPGRGERARWAHASIPYAPRLHDRNTISAHSTAPAQTLGSEGCTPRQPTAHGCGPPLRQRTGARLQRSNMIPDLSGPKGRRSSQPGNSLTGGTCSRLRSSRVSGGCCCSRHALQYGADVNDRREDLTSR